MPRNNQTQTTAEVSHRLQALEIIHGIKASFTSNPDTVYDRIVLAIADRLKAPLTMIHEFDNGTIRLGAQCYKGELSHLQDVHHCTACSIMTESAETRQHIYTSKNQSCFPHDEFKSFLDVPIIDHDGLLVGIVCIFDTDERKYSDTDVDFVEIFVNFLAKEFSEKRHFTIAQQPFKQNQFAKLVSGVSDEVRNRLNAIFVNTEALFLNIQADSDLQTFQGHIRQQVTSLATLMGDLMSLGMPIGKDNFYNESISSLVLEAYSYWRQCISNNSRKVNLELHCSDCLMVMVDKIRLRDALVNLLMNAHKHSPDGGEIWLSVSVLENQWALIRVKNSGAAVSNEQLSQAFEPFSPVGTSNTGLGLSIVKHIVECHGGSVSIFNNCAGIGFTVELKLPLVKG